MSQNIRNTFFVGVKIKNGRIIGHKASSDPAAFSTASSQKQAPEPTVITPPIEMSEFYKVFRGFVTTMDSYRKFTPMTISFAPFMVTAFAGKPVWDFAKSKGRERTDLSRDELSVYELDINCAREFNLLHEQFVSAIEGTKRLPEIMIIGLISSYDAFLTRLLKVVLNKQEEIFFTSEKSILFSELLKFDTLEDAKRSLIDKEVESVIRSGHHEQFAWMEKRLDVKLREGLKIWLSFIEICERRNLLTHNGGVASKQYIKNGIDNKYNISNINVGDILPVDSAYFSSAVSVIYEIGVKLCYVLWRKFLRQDADKADTIVNDLGFNLIHGQAYEIAEAILRFGVEGFKGKRVEYTLSMMIINLANAIRLQNREDEARNLLDSKDWSASDRLLKIGVAAVRGNVDELVDMMLSIGDTGSNAEQYRTWPIFRGLQSNVKFIESFEKIFGEPLISAASVNLENASGSIDSLDLGSSTLPLTTH